MSFFRAKLLDRYFGGLLLRLLRPLRRRAATGPVHEIVVVKFWGVGNAAMLLPVLRALRRRYPDARLTALTLAHNRELFAQVADEVLTVRLRPLPTAMLDMVRAVATLRARKIDLAVDFEQFVRASQVLLFLAGAGRVVAFDTPAQHRAGLATHKVRYDDTQHAADSFLALARAAGVTGPPEGGVEIELLAAARARAWARAGGRDGRPLVLLHPGSGDNFTGRRWPAARFAELARRLTDETDAVVAVTGTRAEREVVRRVIALADRGLADLSGRLSLPELVAFLARASLLVANDTGPVHLASALDVPVLGLYGPNSPLLYGPRSVGSVAFYDAPACSPCITNFNYKTSRCRNAVCIEAIDVDVVAAAALRVLSADGRAERTA